MLSQMLVPLLLLLLSELGQLLKKSRCALLTARIGNRMTGTLPENVQHIWIYSGRHSHLHLNVW